MQKRNLMIGGASALLAVSLGFLSSVLLASQRPAPAGVADSDVTTIVGAVYAACGDDATCIKDGLRGVANTSPATTADAVLGLFTTPSAPRGGCHWAMHLLGQTLKERTRSDDDLGLTGRWHLCGYAILHGAFEDVPLQGGVLEVGRSAFDVCLNGVLENELVGQCFHAIGHTVGMNLPGSQTAPYLLEAEAACIEGAWHIREIISSQAPLKACVSGAHMRHRDTVLQPEDTPLNALKQDPARVLPQCEHSLLAYACITLYMENAFAAQDDRAADRLLAWCVQKSPEAGDVCGYFYGLATRGVANETAATAVRSCVRNESVPENVVLACLSGALLPVGGSSGKDTSEQELCQHLTSTVIPCATVRAFTVRYPALPDRAKYSQVMSDTSRD